MHPYLSSQLAGERHAELVAAAGRGRLARQARAGRLASPSAGWGWWRLRRAPRPVTPAPA